MNLQHGVNVLGDPGGMVTGAGHGGITSALQTQFSSLFSINCLFK